MRTAMSKRTLRTFGLAAISLLAGWACSNEETNDGRLTTCSEDQARCDDDGDNDVKAAGALAVEKRQCNSCHDGPLGKMAGNPKNLATEPGVELYAPNLTNDYDTGIGSWTDEAIGIAIRSGLDKDGLQLCPQMQHFAESGGMDEVEAHAIITYLRSLPKVVNQLPRSVCPPLKIKEEQN